MQQERLENLENLIQTSPLLSAPERDDWLQLLELMNDKQLLELEKILQSTPAAAPPVSFVAPPQQPLRLSHIVNLPKVSPQTQASRPVLEKAPQSQGFLGRLKSILSEKELPSGSAQGLGELELPAARATVAGKSAADQFKPPSGLPKSNIAAPFSLGTKPLQTSLRRPPVVPRPKPKPAPISFSQPSPPKTPIGVGDQPPRFGAGPDLGFAQDKNKAQAEIAQALAKNFRDASSAVKPSPLSPKTAAPASARPLEPVVALKNLPDFKPLPKSFQKSAAAKDFSGQKGLNKWPEFKGSSSPSQPAGEVSQPLALQNLNNLSVADFSQTQGGELAKRLQQLVKNFGYYEVIFHLEKSPLFQSYIETGLDVLNNKAGFAQLGQPAGDKRLSRPQFELFADLLRQIQEG